MVAHEELLSFRMLSAIRPKHRFQKLMAECCVLIAILQIKKAAPIKIRECGRETNGARLFSLPYAGITQVRF